MQQYIRKKKSTIYWIGCRLQWHNQINNLIIWHNYDNDIHIDMVGNDQQLHLGQLHKIWVLTLYFFIFSICLKFSFFFFFFFFCFCFCFFFIFPGLSVFYFSFFRSCIFLSCSAWVCFLFHVFNLSIISCFFFVCFCFCFLFVCLFVWFFFYYFFIFYFTFYFHIPL